jgi:hypothetical protein
MRSIGGLKVIGRLLSLLVPISYVILGLVYHGLAFARSSNQGLVHITLQSLCELASLETQDDTPSHDPLMLLLFGGAASIAIQDYPRTSSP